MTKLSQKISKLQEITSASARPLPVVLLADTSGSMSEHGKIQALNTAAADMTRAFATEEQSRVLIHLAVVTFGGTAAWHLPLTPTPQVKWQPLSANGSTPLGAALTLCQALVEDPVQVPSRAYRPALILCSDGQPNDEWQAPLAALHTAPRAGKAQRFALAIGPDADLAMLQRFVGAEGRVFLAHEAHEIQNFFRFVTMTVTSRSRSVNPNQIPASSSVALPALDFSDDQDF